MICGGVLTSLLVRNKEAGPCMEMDEWGWGSMLKWVGVETRRTGVEERGGRVEVEVMDVGC